MQQRQIQHVALREAAAKPVCLCRQACKQSDRKGLIAPAECDQSAAGGQSELTRDLSEPRRQRLISGQHLFESLIHESPARAWTIDELANEVALSRSAFFERFMRLIGRPPMQYLTQWRMAVAATLLRQSRAPVVSIALDVGYESEAAFARAFKRLVGTPPARWRRIQ